MITFTHKGHKVSIRNDDWKSLKRRFKPDNAKKAISGDYLIDIPCSLCERHYNPDLCCQKCPLDKISGFASFGCTILINSILRKKTFRLGFNDIEWDKIDNSKARRQLKAIIRRMEKIEQNQEEK